MNQIRKCLRTVRKILTAENHKIMKILFKITRQNVSYYNRSTKGYEFIKTIESDKDGYDTVARYEDIDFFPQEDGKVFDQNGNEVYDPDYPKDFDFGDYNYYIADYDSLDQYNDAHVIRAIESSNPWNIDEIRELYTN